MKAKTKNKGLRKALRKIDKMDFKKDPIALTNALAMIGVDCNKHACELISATQKVLKRKGRKFSIKDAVKLQRGAITIQRGRYLLNDLIIGKDKYGIEHELYKNVVLVVVAVDDFNVIACEDEATSPTYVLFKDKDFLKKTSYIIDSDTIKKS